MRISQDAYILKSYFTSGTESEDEYFGEIEEETFDLNDNDNSEDKDEAVDENTDGRG